MTPLLSNISTVLSGYQRFWNLVMKTWDKLPETFEKLRKTRKKENLEKTWVKH